MMETCRWPKASYKRVIDYLRRHAQAGSRIAVDYQAGFQCVVLQIAIHILKLRDRSQLLLHQRAPKRASPAGCHPAACTGIARCRFARLFARPVRGAIKSVAPGTRASLGRSRFMTSNTLALRSASGFKVILR